MFPAILKSKTIWRQEACLPTNQAGAARRAEHFIFLSHEGIFPGNLPMLGNKPQSLPFDILSLFKTKPFLQYSNISQEDIPFLPAPRMGLLVNFVSNGSQIHIPSLSELCTQKKDEESRAKCD